MRSSSHTCCGNIAHSTYTDNLRVRVLRNSYIDGLFSALFMPACWPNSFTGYQAMHYKQASKHLYTLVGRHEGREPRGREGELAWAPYSPWWSPVDWCTWPGHVCYQVAARRPGYSMDGRVYIYGVHWMDSMLPTHRRDQSGTLYVHWRAVSEWACHILYSMHERMGTIFGRPALQLLWRSLLFMREFSRKVNRCV